MNERDIFLALLDIPDAAARAAYLERACAGDEALRGRVESLLRSHEAAGSFLAPDPLAGDGPTQTLDAGADAPEDEALGFLEPPGRPDSLGRLGHHEVLEVLGRGGFGIVFRAFDERLQRVAAVKVLSPALAVTSPARKRFLREARSSAAVRHENVVQVYAVEERPLPYLVMELVPGETLQERIDRTGPLEAGEALRIARQIAEGLAAAHDKGLVHRDIKPSNILLDAASGQVKITDFGLARAADDASLTRSGVVAGTPMYMAPEQAKGEALDQRADLFSLGSVMYVMLAGRPPFRAENTPAVLKRVAEDAPRPIREVIPEVPQWLCRVVEKLHAKEPGKRFQTAREVADLLADCEAQIRAHGAIKDFSRIPGGPPPRRGLWRAAAVLWALGVLTLLAWGTGHLEALGRALGLVVAWGKLRVEVDDRETNIVVEGGRVADSAPGSGGVHVFRLPAGSYRVRVTKAGGVLQETAVRVEADSEASVRFTLGLAGGGWKPAEGGEVPGWGRVIDPEGGCKVETEGGRLRLTPPVEYRDLSAWYKVYNAPRLTREVRGDFRVRVKVLPFPAAPAGPPGASYRSVDLFLWKDEKHFVRVGRTSGTDAGGKPELTHNVVAFRPGQEASAAAPEGLRRCDPAAPSHLELERRGDTVSVRASADGVAWSEPLLLPAPRLPEAVSVGVVAVRGGWSDRFSAELEGFEVTPLATAEDEGWVPLLNGKDLTGWVLGGGPPAWKVRDGELHGELAKAEPRAAFLRLAGPEPGDFDLRFEVRIEAGWAHVNFRTEPGPGVWKGYRWDVCGPLYSNVLRHYLCREAEDDPVRAEGWHRVEMSARGGRFKFKVGERVTADVTDPDAGKHLGRGALRLQINPGTKVAFRKIEIREMLPPPADAPFTPARARELQQGWARHLGVPAEFVNSARMRMRLIPPGGFDVGTGADDILKLLTDIKDMNDARNVRSEAPRARARLDAAFYLASHEVTVAQFRAFVAATGHRTDAEKSGVGGFSFHEGRWVRRPEHTWSSPGPWQSEDDHPVAHVSWADAMAFCAWLSKKEGRRYTLPDERQWEHAARAGTSGLYGPEDDPASADAIAWTNENTRQPRPVGSKQANAWGLHDMLGNVWEWCADEGGIPGTRVQRGGTWYRPRWFSRCAARAFGSPALTDAGIGFRIALVGDLKAKPPATRPFVVTATELTKQQQFATLAEALAAAPAGAVIEVRGDGPFDVKAFSVDRPLTIRAGDGSRPVLELVPAAGFDDTRVRVHDVLALEGLDIRARCERPSSLFLVMRGPGAVLAHHCRLANAGGGHVLNGGAARVEVRHSSLIGNGSAFIWQPYTGGGRSVVDQSVLCGHAGLLTHVWSRPPGKAALSVRDSTVLGTTSALGLYWGHTGKSPPEGKVPPEVTLDVGGSVLYGRGNFLALWRYDDKEGPEEPLRFLRCWHWRSGGLLVGPAARMFWDYEANQPPGGKAFRLPEDWNKPWKAGAAPLVGVPRFEGGDVLGMTPEARAGLPASAFRLTKDSPGKGKGAGGKDLGADVSLVGPGAPYEAWRQSPGYAAWRRYVAGLMADGPTKR